METALQRITDAIDPYQVIAFGSAVDGQFSDQSDLDLLIVCDDQDHIRSARRELRTARPLCGDIPVDLIWMTRADYEKKSKIGGVAMIAHESGRALYERVND